MDILSKLMFYVSVLIWGGICADIESPTKFAFILLGGVSFLALIAIGTGTILDPKSYPSK